MIEDDTVSRLGFQAQRGGRENIAIVVQDDKSRAPAGCGVTHGVLGASNQIGHPNWRQRTKNVDR